MGETVSQLHVYDPRLAKRLRHFMDMLGGVCEHRCVCMDVSVLECVGEGQRGKRVRVYSKAL